MKRNLIAVILSVVIAVGNIGTVPVYAADVAVQDTEEDIIDGEDENEDSPLDTSDDSTEEDLSSSDQDSNGGDVEEDASGDEGSTSEESDISVSDENTENEEDIISDDDSNKEENPAEDTLIENETDDELINETANEKEPTSVAEENTIDRTLSSNGDFSTNNSSNLIATGNCGKNYDNLTWTVYDDGVLEISGTGEMADYSSRVKSPWIDYKDQITEIVVCDGVTSLGRSFTSDLNISSLTLPPSVGYVHSEALFGLSDKSLYFDGSVFQWMNRSWHFTYLIPYQLYVKNSQDYELVTDLTLLNGIESIPARAFENCASLTSVTIPNSVTSIEEAAFSYCTEISELIISDSVERIGNYAFYGCSSIQSLIIPESVTFIDAQAFGSCASLSMIQFPKDITFGGNLGLDIWNLQEIRGYDGSTAYIEFVVKKIDGANYIWTSIGRTTQGKCGESIQWSLQNGILNIEGTGDMYDAQLWTGLDIDYVFISEGVTSIGERVFEGLNFEGISLPDSLHSIGKYAFLYCNSLQEIVLPDQVTVIPEGAFWQCRNLHSVTLPSSLISIDEYAFNSCSKLASIDLPYSTTLIEKYAFYGCSELENVKLSDSLTELGECAFQSTGVKNIAFPNSLTKIGEKCFKYCGELTEIEIPGSVNEIGNEAFFWTSVDKAFYKGTIDDFVKSNLTFGSLKRSYYDTDYVSLYCLDNSGEYYLIEDIELSDNISLIPSGKFSGCDQLKSVNMPNSLISIENGAFYDCDGLENVNISEGVKSIGSGAFSKCPNLKRIKMPSTITSLVDPFGKESGEDPDIILVVYENSCAHTYAVENNLQYEINTEEIKADSVTLSVHELTIEKGTSQQLTAEILPVSTLT